MTRLVFCVCACLLFVYVARPEAAVTYGNNCTVDEAAGDASTSCTITGVQAGSAIVACVVANTGTIAQGITFSDDRSNSYTDIEDNDASVLEVAVGWAVGVAAGDTIVSVGLSSDHYRRIFAIEVLGITTSSPLDDSDSDTGIGTTATTPALTASQAGASLACVSVFGADTISVGGGYTQIDEDESFANAAGSFARQTVAGAGSVTPTWTLGSSLAWVAAGIELKESLTASACQRTLVGVGC